MQNYRVLWFCFLFVGVAVSSQRCHAQAVRIQQPIVQQFSAGTTLTIPDRGSALIGGYRSGAIRSRQTGPFRRGSYYSQSFQSSTASVGVYIHDFEAMDRMLLNQGASVLRPASDPFSPHQHWQQQLLSPRDSDKTASGLDRATAGSSARAETAAQSKAQRFYQLGQKAEEKYASPNIAILHYRAAEKYGSLAASERLRELTASKAGKETAEKN